MIGQFRRRHDERWYYTLMMSTGLTFGTISALYGFSHNIITQGQYSFLVAVVIGSAVVPTLIAGYAFLPRHLLPKGRTKRPRLKKRKRRKRDKGHPAHQPGCVRALSAACSRASHRHVDGKLA